jgi:hypothetical protein
LWKKGREEVVVRGGWRRWERRLGEEMAGVRRRTVMEMRKTPHSGRMRNKV